MHCVFATDLHGKASRYRTFFDYLESSPPDALLLGGDLLPGAMREVTISEAMQDSFLLSYLAPELRKLRESLGNAYPKVYAILGNDDGRAAEPEMKEIEAQGLWCYLHGRVVSLGEYDFFGYSYVPPTPFLLKDWERYDVSRYVDPGCVSPEEGMRTIPVSDHEKRWTTIAADLNALSEDRDMSKAVLLFHSPPYDTELDRAGLDGRMVDHVQVDLHVGSIAIRRFIEDRQPLLTLHGHVHESTRLTGKWRQNIGRTHCMNAAHDGSELCVIRFDLENLASAERLLL